MKIICLFGQRRHDTDIIELMSAWDEYSVNANPEGMEENFEEAKRSWGSDLLESRVVRIDVPYAAIQEAFGGIDIKGTVVPESSEAKTPRNYAKAVVDFHRMVHAALDSDGEWQAKYDCIFKLYEESGLDIKWVDPDTSYEEDVKAFVENLDVMAQPFLAIVNS